MSQPTTPASSQTIAQDMAKLDSSMPIMLAITDISEKHYKKTGETFYVTTFQSSDRKTKLIKELENLMTIGDKLIIIPQLTKK